MSEKTELFVTVRQEAHVEFEEKRSIFLGHAVRTDSEEEAQAFADKLWKALQPRLTRYWATVAKIKSDGQCQLFDAEGKLITEGNGARGYIESFLQHPPLD